MAYSQIGWTNLPSTNTSVNASNLGHMDGGIADAYNSIGANAYDNTSTYNIGSYCIYNNTLYRCNTTISTAEDFNSSHWDEVTILQGIADTGWRTLSLATGITQYSSSNAYKCRYRKIGQIVYVEGCVKGISANNTDIATLPAGYRSNNTRRYVTGRNISSSSILTLDQNGTISFVGLTNGSISATDFVYIQYSFIAD